MKYKFVILILILCGISACTTSTQQSSTIPPTNTRVPATPTSIPEPTFTSTPTPRELAEEHYIKGIEFHEEREWDSAIAAFSEAIAIDPEYAEAYINRGLSYYLSKDSEAAISDFETALELDYEPQSPQMYVNRGRAYSILEDMEQAIADFTKAIELDLEFIEAYIWRGNIFSWKLNDFEKAFEDFKIAISIDPENALVYQKRGHAYGMQGDHEAAIDDFTVAIDLDPLDPVNYGSRGYEYWFQGEYEKAIADYDLVIELDDQDATAYCYRGLSKYFFEDHESAIADLNKAVELDPQSASYLYFRGMIYAEIAEIESAVKDLEKALELGLEPNYEDHALEQLDELANLESAIADLVPQKMLPGAMDLSSALGTNCSYQRDEWNESSAYIAFECSELDISWLSIRFTNLQEGETASDLFGDFPPEGFLSIEPSDRFSKDGETVVIGRIDNSEFDYFTVLETENFVISTEIFFPEDTGTTLEDFYTSEAEEIINAVLQLMLDNAKMATSPLPPLSAEEQIIADQYGPILISEDFLRNLLDEDWELERYNVDFLGNDENMPGMCESYVSSYRKISNCVNQVGPDFSLDYVAEWYGTAWEFIEPKKEFEYETLFYGIWDNSWIIQGYMLVDGYLLYAHFDGIHIGGSIADALAGYVDDYVSEILLENVSKLPE